ncbi:glycoside hydrolase family 65 protein [Allorhizocola rhizosphaerae]|uniref:glycoside hydrolase family 65 protein n=1 Tax=Allorhizocola rhizosphaerae TaxID=1872709 RepID=UPI000E3D6B34|nr:glycoside hydrolase family 65 protein [Allorhizocola rhizosphaerae]
MAAEDTPISPAKVTKWPVDALPAYLSNGLTGLRVRHIPALRGIAMVSGFEGIDPGDEVETFARVPYPLATDIAVNGLPLSLAPDRARFVEQHYDFATGELHSTFEFDPGGAAVEVQMLTLCSSTHPTIVLQETRVKAQRACEITLSAGIDPSKVLGEWADRTLGEQGGVAGGCDGMLLWRSYGGLSICGAAYLSIFDGSDDVARSFVRDRMAPLRTDYTFTARGRRMYRLRQMTSLVPDLMHTQPHLQAARLLQAAQLRGFDTLRRLNRDAWKRVWRSRVVLDGAPARWQAMADAAMFYLHTSVHPSSVASTSIFGLAYWPNYHYFRGHIMWDIETFAVPPLLLTYPEAAASLLRYRSRHLEAASANASMNGYRGVQFPWESSLKQGQEVGPGTGSAPSLEHHVTQDVAIAFARYVHATGDLEFAQRHAWPLVSGVAKWLSSRVERSKRGYEIRRVTGIAETPHPRDNNAFTNIGAILALREAITLGRLLGRHVPGDWSDVADNMVIPMDETGTVILNHDGYHPDQEKAATPEAAAALFPFDYDPGPEITAATLRFYLKLGDRYAGSPMLSAMLGVYAARLGDRGAALEMFERGYADFVRDPYRITLEYAPRAHPDQPQAGPFTANLGGFLTSCLYGLTGLVLSHDDPGTWCRHRIVMPSGWNGLHVKHLWARQRPIGLTAEHGAEHAIIDIHDNEPPGRERRRAHS